MTGSFKYLAGIICLVAGTVLAEESSKQIVPSMPFCTIVRNSDIQVISSHQLNTTIPLYSSEYGTKRIIPTHFDFPDTQLGIVTALDGKGYTFFGSDGDCHYSGLSGPCNSPALYGAQHTLALYGSITQVQGTLDDPIESQPWEVLMPPPPNLDAFPNFDGSTGIVYLGGGPAIQGGDIVLLVTQIAYNTGANSFTDGLVLNGSGDGGATWKSLGLVITPHVKPEYNQSADVGDGNLVIRGDYLYIFFPDALCYPDQKCNIVDNIGNHVTIEGPADTGMSVARIEIKNVKKYLDIIKSPLSSGIPNDEIPKFRKFYDPNMPTFLSPAQLPAAEYLNDPKYWTESGIGGKSSNIWNPAGAPAGGVDVKWSDSLNGFVAVFDNNTNAGIAFSPDGITWSPVKNFISAQDLIPEGESIAPSVRYATLYMNDVPHGQLTQKIDLFYNVYPNDGNGWNKTTERRTTLECTGKFKPKVTSPSGPSH